MFCKFCGHEIPNHSEFCPQCGKKLNNRPLKEKPQKTAFIPFVLIMFILCGSSILGLLRVLLFNDSITVGFLLESLKLLAGLVILGICTYTGKLRIADYRYSDLLVMVCVWWLIPTLLTQAEAKYTAYIVGHAASAVFWEFKLSVEPLLQFSGFWMILGIVLLGLGRCGKWKPTKKQKLVLAAILLVRSFLGFILAPSIAASLGTYAEFMDMLVKTSRAWLMLCWLWPLLILTVFWWFGNDKVGVKGAAFSLLGMHLGELIIFPLLMAGALGFPKFGIRGCGIAEGLSPLFGFLLLCISARLHKKKKTQTTEEN